MTLMSECGMHGPTYAQCFFVNMYEFVLVNRYLAVIVLTAKIVTIRASDMHKFTYFRNRYS